MTPLDSLRAAAFDTFEAGVRGADAKAAVWRHFSVEGDRLAVGDQRYDLNQFDRVYVVGAGKASGPMAAAVVEALSGRVAKGVVNVKLGQQVQKLPGIRLNPSEHPIPGARGLTGAQEMATLLASAGERDLVICVISGGASALLPLPEGDITLEDKQKVNALLLACGASIHEVNAVRKHISKLKCGRLARLAYPATVVALLLSDVVGDNLDVIGSGPTSPDQSTFEQAKRICDDYRIYDDLPKRVQRHIERGLAGEIEEGPRANDVCFARSQNVVVGNNVLALDAAAQRAQELGFNPLVLCSCVQGETREIARMHAAIAKDILFRNTPVRVPACVITGGETTVTLPAKHGKGGRNQEFALAAAIEIAGLGPIVVLSGGTDGTDGPTDAAGAVSDSETVSAALKRGLRAKDFLTRHDAYNFFREKKGVGGLLRDRDFNTNVMDLRIVMVGKNTDPEVN
jgi:hydroxypyruvate reductase